MYLGRLLPLFSSTTVLCFLAWLSVQEGDDRTKKVTRVIAPSRKTSKQAPQPKHKGKNKQTICFFLKFVKCEKMCTLLLFFTK